MADRDARADAMRLAHERAAANPSGIGAAYAGPAARNPNQAPPPGWRGGVALADSETSNVVVLVVAESRLRTSKVDAQALAEAVEAIAVDLGGVDAVREASREGPGLRLEVHAADHLPAIFG